MIENPGFAFTPVWRYNKENIQAPKWRIKEWDYYLINSKDYAVAFTISDLAYLGMISVSVLDFRVPSNRTQTVLTSFPMGKFNLPATPDAGISQYIGKDVQIKVNVKDGKRHLRCHYPKFDQGKDLDADLILEDLYDESMVIATPWSEKPTCFYYNQKNNCIAAEGTVTIGDEVFTFSKDTDFAVLDWGRGVWTYDNTWYWGTGSGLVDGKTFGINWGYGFSDRSSASENVIFYDGKVHKLSEVFFHIPKNDKGEYMFEEQWKITSDDNRVNGIFEPIIDRYANTDLKVIISTQHQVFGKFTGTVILDNSEAITVKDFICALEMVRNKY
ncbi:MAG: DUF2804 domain-containing protein [Erysipelotrichales bacterium]|nr:DUF2804 domain-containing protein [Erysipelotrichales bacterium]